MVFEGVVFGDGAFRDGGDFRGYGDSGKPWRFPLAKTPRNANGTVFFANPFAKTPRNANGLRKVHL